MPEQEPESLWGDLPLGGAARAPIVFLREQAAVLTKQTRGMLRGEVSSRGENGDQLRGTLDIVVPALNDHRHRLLMISHDVRLYPVYVSDFATNLPGRNCKTEAEYVARLKEILGSERVRHVIATLIARVQATDG